MMKKLISLLFTFLFSMVLFSSYGIEFDNFTGIIESIPDSTSLKLNETELNEIEEAIPSISSIQQPNNSIIEDNINSNLETDYSKEINQPATKLEPEEILDEKPTTQPSTKVEYNRNSLIAFFLIPPLFILGVLAIYLLLFGSWITLALLLVIIGFGCIISLVLSIVSAIQIKKNEPIQKGERLSALAGICSIIGIGITTLLFLIIYDIVE